MAASEEAAFELYDEFAASDTDFGSILSEWTTFREDIQQWHGLAETAMLNFGAG